MKYLLDTNICIYLIKSKPVSVRQHFEMHAMGDVGVSSITVVELQYGAEKSQQIERNLAALEQFFLPLVIADFDVEAARRYGRIRTYLEKQGTLIGSLGTLIAAHALRLGVTLVTNNVKEFARVPGLQTENWVE